MMRVKAVVLGLMLAFGSSGVWAQTGCQGQPAAGGICGNPNATAGFPSWATMTALLDRNFGGPSTQGTMLNRGASVWSATTTPSLGKNGGTGGSLTLNGATSGSAVIGVNVAAGSTTFNLPVGNGTNSFVLTTDGSGNTSWTNPASGGTVTSVGLSLPGIFSVSGSPVTITGTLTGTLANQSANLVWAGPNTGAAAAPTFRSLVGADLPNPSASTLGGVQSFAAVGSQWIRQISTSGVPTASQPAFTDISGVAGFGQLPSTSSFLDVIGSVQGDVLYRGASGWSVLAPGTAGQLLATGGAAANPSWTTVSGSGTVTSVSTGAGLTGGPITISGTVSLSPIASGTLLANLAVGLNAPVSTTPSAVLDTFGTAQGNILYRAGGAWNVLGPGTAGQVLQTGGAGANPSWGAVTATTIDAGGATSITNGKSGDYLFQSNSASVSHTGMPYAAFSTMAGAL
jgi:hypothetical protein